jgi:hypothetical protein
VTEQAGTSAAETSSFTYDKNGQQASQSDASGTTSDSYETSADMMLHSMADPSGSESTLCLLPSFLALGQYIGR